MRTTLNIADDVLQAAKERGRREGRSAGDVLSDLAREALTGRHRLETHGASFHGFEPFPHRGAAISNALIDDLRDEEIE
jgi:hypothetical protein